MPGRTAPPVYVILVNTNGWRDTLECLESVFRSDYPAVRAIVCDNASADGSVAQILGWASGDVSAPAGSTAMTRMTTPPVAKPLAVELRTRAELEKGTVVDWTRAKLLVVECGANLGFTGANNVAMKYAMTQERDALVWVLNNDTVVAPDALRAMVDAADAGKRRVGAVGATLLRYHDPERIETLGGGAAGWHGMSRMIHAGGLRSAVRTLQGNTAGVPGADGNGAGRIDFISGCSILVPRATLDQVGLLDERFFIYCEDADWGLRMRQAGLNLVYCPQAEVWHKGGATAVQHSDFHDYHTVKSVLHFAKKHRPRAFPIAALYATARFLGRKIARREWSRVGSVRRAFADFRRERQASPGFPPADFPRREVRLERT